MYSTLRFINYGDFQLLDQSSTLSLLSMIASGVRPSKEELGGSENNKELLFNPNCIFRLILEHICRETGTDIDSDFDLCTANGAIVGINNIQYGANGLEVLRKQETYYIVLYKRNSAGDIIKITPLLNKYTKEYADMLAKLRRSNSNILKKSGSANPKQKSSHSYRRGEGSTKSLVSPHRSTTRRRSKASY